jgi:hypothetical protein
MGEYYALIGILFNIKPKPKTKNQSQKTKAQGIKPLRFLFC